MELEINNEFIDNLINKSENIDNLSEEERLELNSVLKQYKKEISARKKEIKEIEKENRAKLKAEKALQKELEKNEKEELKKLNKEKMNVSDFFKFIYSELKNLDIYKTVEEIILIEKDGKIKILFDEVQFANCEIELKEIDNSFYQWLLKGGSVRLTLQDIKVLRDLKLNKGKKNCLHLLEKRDEENEIYFRYLFCKEMKRPISKTSVYYEGKQMYELYMFEEERELIINRKNENINVDNFDISYELKEVEEDFIFGKTLLILKNLEDEITTEDILIKDGKEIETELFMYMHVKDILIKLKDTNTKYYIGFDKYIDNLRKFSFVSVSTYGKMIQNIKLI